MAPEQQPPAGTASADQTGRRLKREGDITGRVIGPDGQPMADASVFAYRIGERLGRGHSATVDDDGNFKLTGLSPSTYILSARAPGYVFDDPPIEDNIHRIGEHVTIRMVKGGVITGRVTDETGEPLVGVIVRPRRLRDPDGKPAISSVESLGLELSVTDDRGIYRAFGLRPGVYIVSIGGRSGYSLDYTQVARGGSIAGRVVVESAEPPKRCAINNEQAEISVKIRERTGRQPIVEEILLKAVQDDPNPRPYISGFFAFDRYGRPPNEKGEFVMKGLEAGRYRVAANLPDNGWRISSITLSVAGAGKQTTGAAKKPVDITRNGVVIKPGEKISGVEVIVAEDAATFNGRVVPAKDGTKLPSWLRAHLIPAEAASADDVIRYAETDLRGDGSFEFKHVAPGKYLLHTRQVAEKDANDDQARPAAWDAAERSKLRREAMAAKNEIELQPCGRVRDYVWRFSR
jgi:hypothetical protein